MDEVHSRIERLEREVTELRALLTDRAERSRLPQQVSKALRLHRRRLKGAMTTACVASAAGLPVTLEVRREIGGQLRRMGLLPTMQKRIRFYWFDEVN